MSACPASGERPADRSSTGTESDERHGWWPRDAGSAKTAVGVAEGIAGGAVEGDVRCPAEGGREDGDGIARLTGRRAALAYGQEPGPATLADGAASPN